MAYTNSPLVNYTKLSPNHSGARKYPITRISIHCVVGQCSVETIGEVFTPTSREASSNYGIGPDGRVGMYVEEKNRSWCTSSSDNDNRAITIETASDTTHPYAVRDAAYQALLNLCTDICKRNGKKKLLWFADKDKSLSYAPAADEMVLTVHRWFANKSCPGDYLYNLHPQIAAEVTKRLGGTAAAPATDTTKKTVAELAKEVIEGKWGNGDDRKNRLTAAGYDYSAVQAKVNEMLGTPASDQKPAPAPAENKLAAGVELKLNGVKLYKSSTAAEESAKKTGTFYVWSDAEVKGRIRITNTKDRVGVSGQVTGWINTADAKAAMSGATAPAAFAPYLVKVSCDVLNVRKGPGTSYAISTQIRRNEVYTIVGEEDGWGKLKSGAGWIYLAYTAKR